MSNCAPCIPDWSVQPTVPPAEPFVFAQHFVFYAYGCDPREAPTFGVPRETSPRFDDERARSAIAGAFADVVKRWRYTVYACAIVPRRVHLVVKRHAHPADLIADRFANAARDALRSARLVSADQPVWAPCRQKSFALSRGETYRMVSRVIRLPRKSHGMSQQKYDFMTPVRFIDWSLYDKNRPKIFAPRAVPVSVCLGNV